MIHEKLYFYLKVTIASILSLMDTKITFYGLSKGWSEKNTFIVWMMDKTNVQFALLLHLFISLSAITFLTVLYERHERDKRHNVRKTFSTITFLGLDYLILTRLYAIAVWLYALFGIS